MPATIKESKFTFTRRSRGVLWVADIVGSTKYLNDDEAVSQLEEFLPRLHWVARLIVTASGGKFVKWTGDGFLAWFEMPLHRNLGRTAFIALRLAALLTLLTHITQFGLAHEKRKFRIRHAVMYEQDALLMKTGGRQSFDLIGRNVVLAFRAVSVPTEFPFIISQKEIVEASKDQFPAHFVHWTPKDEDILKYFKGESWATRSLYVTAMKKVKPRNFEAALKSLRRIAKRHEDTMKIVSDQGQKMLSEHDAKLVRAMEEGFKNGPPWAQQTVADTGRFLTDFYGGLKPLVNFLEKVKKEAPHLITNLG
jgi:class 3 adenylate cyclase